MCSFGLQRLLSRGSFDVETCTSSVIVLFLGLGDALWGKIKVPGCERVVMVCFEVGDLPVSGRKSWRLRGTGTVLGWGIRTPEKTHRERGCWARAQPCGPVHVFLHFRLCELEIYACEETIVSHHQTLCLNIDPFSFPGTGCWQNNKAVPHTIMFLSPTSLCSRHITEQAGKWFLIKMTYILSSSEVPWWTLWKSYLPSSVFLYFEIET
jgi:hypothetical protein